MPQRILHTFQFLKIIPGEVDVFAISYVSTMSTQLSVLASTSTMSQLKDKVSQMKAEVGSFIPSHYSCADGRDALPLTMAVYASHSGDTVPFSASDSLNTPPASSQYITP